MGRRRRQLLGRATSNISNHSNGSAGAAAALSRASSVDTINTDGLGTPLDHSHNSYPVVVRKTSLDIPSLKALHYADLGSPLDAEADKQNLQQCTQLGYEDPDVKAWRERVMRKMGGGGEEKGEGRRVMRVTGTVVDSKVGKGVAGRTRGSVRGV